MEVASLAVRKGVVVGNALQQHLVLQTGFLIMALFIFEVLRHSAEIQLTSINCSTVHTHNHTDIHIYIYKYTDEILVDSILL